MLKNLFSKLFKSGTKTEDKLRGHFLVAQLNDKIMPIDRGDKYEDPLDEYLKSINLGEVTGGGTLQKESGEIEYCDVEIQLAHEQIIESELQLIIRKLEELGAPRGSRLIIERINRTIDFGKNEGLAIHLDGINLPEKVYQESDVNEVVSELSRLIPYTESIQRYWEGNSGTVFYFYGPSFQAMKTAISDYVNTQPLCENAKIERIA